MPTPQELLERLELVGTRSQVQPGNDKLEALPRLSAGARSQENQN